MHAFAQIFARQFYHNEVYAPTPCVAAHRSVAFRAYNTTNNDRLARDWFRDQVLAMGADHKANTTGTQFAVFLSKDNSITLIAMGTYLDTSIVTEAHALKSNDHPGIAVGCELAKIGYVGNGPNTFKEFLISTHFEIHVEQFTDLEEAGTPVGEDCHTNTYPMYGRRDALVGAVKAIAAVKALACKQNGDNTITSIHSGLWGACNTQSSTKLSFCLMHKQTQGLDPMSVDIETQVKGITAMLASVWSGRDREPDGYRPRYYHDYDSYTNGRLFVREKDGINYNPKGWSDKEGSMEGILVLGKAVLDFYELLKTKGSRIEVNYIDYVIV
ncbi:uncharacterized protein BDR25DRAFT_365091 [Lindgomyces ingoldianus]|uniref:Uncharacterized protein n=1 Tax=Lindgomyces ingoldianus TaxID=673940 RepID=A0ACB6RFJ6_9PLEO|nr:uncharacterized protein BDR25DRAFT_365091 [Lindgomyces ingoldianus]KAF2478063.1 hypothetical protein BDR25DRAFT_365091 [Lindgomyces ingoldianus]